MLLLREDLLSENDLVSKEDDSPPNESDLPSNRGDNLYPDPISGLYRVIHFLGSLMLESNCWLISFADVLVDYDEDGDGDGDGDGEGEAGEDEDANGDGEADRDGDGDEEADGDKNGNAGNNKTVTMKALEVVGNIHDNPELSETWCCGWSGGRDISPSPLPPLPLLSHFSSPTSPASSHLPNPVPHP